MNSVVHNFQECLAESLTLSDEGSWIGFYQRLWPEALSIVRIDANSEWQRFGIDRMILLPNGKQITVDEKKRNSTWDDFLCEEWSVFQDNQGVKPGWTIDPNKRCDLIAYVIVPLSKCYLLPFELLRITTREFLPDWKKLIDNRGRPVYPKDARNNGYVTRNCPVPWDCLFADMRRIMHRRFDQGLSLPQFDVIRGQAVFEWGK